jgi:two-component system, chemotaxis family, sensor kinase CheA
MDDFLSDFLVETGEGLAELDNDLILLESDPGDIQRLSNIFRTVHTIKGTCGFIGLPRLERLAHAAENLLGRFRDGELLVTPNRVTLILASLDQIKAILTHLEQVQAEPEGEDTELIARLDLESELENDAGEQPPEPSVEESPIETHATPVETEAENSDTGASIIEMEGGAVSQDLESFFSGESDFNQEFMYGHGAGDVLGSDEAPVQGLDPSNDSRVEQKDPAAGPAQPVASADTAPEAQGKQDPIANQSIRVSVDLLENLMTMVSELVLTRNQLLQISRTDEQDELSVPFQRLSQVTTELQEGVMKTRMQPIGNGWAKLPRLVRDLNKDTGKKAELIMTGAETDLDRQVLELIRDPLTHMIRNAVDHGLETPLERAATGKPETGRIGLHAYHEGGHILIQISDDGKGLNADKIKSKAIQNEILDPSEAGLLSDQQAYQLIFRPGFSTAEAVTAVSGRGVGMDVVRTNVDKIGGTIEVKSSQGQGSTFIIKIPLTLAIVSALIVSAAGERFAIPQISVVELVRIRGTSEHEIEEVRGTPVLRLRQKLLPLVSLSALLELQPDNEDAQEQFVVVTQVGAYRFGLMVDSVFDTEEIVVKPTASILRDISAFSGNTILGDGSVIMILDPNGIVAASGEPMVQDDSAQSRDSGQQGAEDAEVSLLLVAGESGRMAVPLSLVARIETLDMSTVELAAGRAVIQYRDQLMPLLALEREGTVPREGNRPVLVFVDQNHSMGLVVNEVVDIVKARLKADVLQDKPGVNGTSIIAGHATDLINVSYYLDQISEDWFKSEIDREQTRNGARQRVLMIDDSGFFRGLMEPILASAGFNVTSVDGGAEALRLCESGHDFDVIVTDIEMPDMDGFEFAETLKSTRWQNLPVVALSSRNRQEDVERGRACGFTDYIAKLDREGLIDALHQIAA